MSNGTRIGSASRGLRVLGFESYDSGSHRSVRQLVSEFSRHEWRWVTRPGRGWSWRMRTGAIELVDLMHDSNVLVQEGGQWLPEAVFATSLVSLGDLRALLPAGMRDLPFMLYMHENQLTYPFRIEHGAGGERDLQYPVTNLMSILAADQVAWNSRWNLDSFCSGLDGLLGHCPDGVLKDAEHRTRERSRVIWPPVRDPGEKDWDERVLHNTQVVVWPHRWEHDKGPEELLALARHARDAGCNLEWILLGQSHGAVHGAMGEFQREFAGSIRHAGWIESHSAYLDMLREADWVLSTAKHEFFGIAVVEAMLCGCLPWLPGRLSYPEITPQCGRGLSPLNPPGDPRAVRRACRTHLEDALAHNAVAHLDDMIDSMVPVDQLAMGASADSDTRP